MAFPTGTIDSSMYALLQGALASGGFDSMKVFFETAFADKFSQVRWTSFMTKLRVLFTKNTNKQLVKNQFR